MLQNEIYLKQESNMKGRSFLGESDIMYINKSISFKQTIQHKLVNPDRNIVSNMDCAKVTFSM